MWLFELMGLSYHNRRLYANTDKRLITIAKNYTALCYGHSNWRSVPEQETVSTTAADRAGAAPDTAGPGGSGLVLGVEVADLHDFVAFQRDRGDFRAGGILVDDAGADGVCPQPHQEVKEGGTVGDHDVFGAFGGGVRFLRGSRRSCAVPARTPAGDSCAAPPASPTPGWPGGGRC